ncbi:T9SS type A sorting domain-containing protein [Lacibacter luteus]|uniref:T9SS type A sorting domain-containing protein n=1 Tax=Lacibacter luteus TaxID=2508719 RepID=A0A4Q1CN89_9BACT|nr:T9SS type A sorting domain-containing protein [Lacibacter luteus]RXK62578.1 T9SS type A sorting domain-containing protein [Lacibacter luteus]
MKPTALIILFLLSTILMYGQRKTAIGNSGQGWSVASNWSPAAVPQSGDTVVIPLGVVMSVKTNVYSTAPDLVILVYGTLNFLSGGKINLGTNSTITVYMGGFLTSTGSPSEIISIGGVTKFKGNVDGTIIGPARATSSSSVSPSGFSASILPVKFESFIVRLSPQKHAVVSWTVSAESDIAEYVVEKSSDARNWQRYSSVDAKNNSSASYTYSVTDTQLSLGKTYYRVIGRSVTDTYYYTSIEQVEDKSTQALSIYPNPVSTVAKIRTQTTLADGVLSVNLYNLYGANVLSQQYKAGTGYIELNIQQLPKGSYTLVLCTEKGARYNHQMIIR